MYCSLPGSSTNGIFQARVLEWGAIAFSVLYYYRVRIHEGILGRCSATRRPLEGNADHFVLSVLSEARQTLDTELTLHPLNNAALWESPLKARGGAAARASTSWTLWNSILHNEDKVLAFDKFHSLKYFSPLHACADCADQHLLATSCHRCIKVSAARPTDEFIRQRPKGNVSWGQRGVSQMRGGGEQAVCPQGSVCWGSETRSEITRWRRKPRQ